MKTIVRCVFSFVCVLSVFVVSIDYLVFDDFLNEKTVIDDCLIRYHGKLTTKQKSAIGSPAYHGEFAHIAAIGWIQPDDNVKWDCGGSLIRANVILTAAHCTKHPDTNLSPDLIRIGDLNLYDDLDDDYVQERNISNITCHPLYNTSSIYYDLALLMLDRGVDLSTGTIPTCLWLDDYIPFRDMQAAGWGATGFEKENSNVLIKAELKIMSNENCKRYYNERSYILLRQGLQDHQLCAWDKVQDTCQGDSGGPLHHKLIYGNNQIPFLVGVTSFGKPCGFSKPGVYVKVSSFRDWIIHTVQQFGGQVSDSTFDPLICAERYLSLRERTTETNFFPAHNRMVQLLWQQNRNDNRCGGVLVEPDAVVTLAQCATFNGSAPTHVKVFESELIEIEEIVVHPNYTEQLIMYNNIAVLKLKTYSTFRSHCIDYDAFEPYNRLRVIGFVPNENDPVLMFAFTNRNKTCNVDPIYSSLLPRGFAEEHFCFGNDEFVVPGSCNLLLGGPIYTHRTYGLTLPGSDCGFGQPAIGLMLSSHRLWLESVFLPTKAQPKAIDLSAYIDTDLHHRNGCSYSYNVMDNVPCKGNSTVCCQNTLVEQPVLHIIEEFNECETRYKRLREARQKKLKKNEALQYSHMAKIGWKQETGVQFGCFGYLISTRGVVTAASCLKAHATNPTVVRLGGLGWRSETTPFTFHRVQSTTAHPAYNSASGEDDIAVIKLNKEVNPTLYYFPGCLWQNKTHAPVQQFILNEHLREFDGINPLFKRDCEKHLNQSISNPGIGCMNVAFLPCLANCPTIFHDDKSFSMSPYFNDYLTGDPYRCYKQGNPIVWRKQDGSHKEGVTEYLVSIYSHRECHVGSSLRTVLRVAFYIEWLAHVLQ